MQLIVLVEPGPARDRWTAMVGDAGLPAPRAADDWASLMNEIMREKPHAVLLDYATLQAGGAAAVNAADMTLRALGVGAVIALGETETSKRYAIEMDTELEHFVFEGGDQDDLLSALRGAIVAVGGAIPESLPGPPEPFVRRRTPVATPAAGMAAVPSSARPRHDDEFTGTERTDVRSRLSSVDDAPPGNRPGDPTPIATAAAREPRQATPPGAADTLAQPKLGLGEAVSRSASASSSSSGSHAAVRAFFGDALDPGTLDEITQRETAQVPALDDGVSDVMAVLDTSGSMSAEVPHIGPSAETPIAATPAAETAPAVAVPDADEVVALGTGFEDESPDGPDGPDTEEIDTAAVVAALREEAAASASGASGATGPTNPVPTADGATERGAAEPDEESAAASTSTASPAFGGLPLLTLTLPDPNGGDLAEVSVPRVFFTLSVARATGELRLRTASLERVVVFFEGEPGKVFDAPTADEERKILSTFGWTHGEYEFSSKRVPEAQFFTYGEPMALLFRGIQRNLGLNETATALGPYLKKYPVATNQVSRFRRVLGLEGLARFADAADGAKTLEGLMVSAGAETEHFLHLAYFAWLSGCVVFTDAPTSGPIPVQFEAHDFVAASPAAPSQESGRTVTLSMSGGTDRELEKLASAAKRTTAARPTPTEDADQHRETYEKLSTKWDVVSSRSPYEVFELEPGCGVDAVNTRFYEMVREYHPDRYARIQNQQIRGLAEKIFVQIRKLHSELTDREKAGGTGAATISGQGVGSGQGLAESGVSRRRRASAARAATSGVNRAVQVPGVSHEEIVTSRRSASTGEHSGAQVPVGQSQRVGDVLNRLRTRGRDIESGGHPAPLIKPPPKTSSNNSSTMTGVRRLAPDQLLRNARAATERGNFEKGLELVTLAVARGAEGPTVSAYNVFLQYTQHRIQPGEAVEQLKELATQTEERSVERGQILTLAGHACRLEELNSEAIEHYDRAVREWPDNESATRWLRHLRRRVAEDEKKKPFSSSFLNKLFTSKPK